MSSDAVLLLVKPGPVLRWGKGAIAPQREPYHQIFAYKSSIQ